MSRCFVSHGTYKTLSRPQYIIKWFVYHKALYIGMAKVLPIIDVLGYDGQNSSFSSPPSRSDSTPITQKRSHLST